MKNNSWTLAPEAKPDVYLVDLMGGKSHTVTFLTDVDSKSFEVEIGKSYDFNIVWDDQICFTRLTGQAFVPAAVFDSYFEAKNRGKILVEIPEVYELVNVAIALTSFGQENRNFIYHDSPYYTKVLDHFAAHLDHPFVTTLDSLLAGNSGRYPRLKMNGNAFVFDENDKIISSPITTALDSVKIDPTDCVLIYNLCNHFPMLSIFDPSIVKTPKFTPTTFPIIPIPPMFPR
ncbi:MAG: hypothetical protein GY780_11440 [bacterium]|nr:hypothetical protein [bacterium]